MKRKAVPRRPGRRGPPSGESPGGKSGGGPSALADLAEIAWTVEVGRILSDPALRFDASHYDPAVDAVVRRLETTGLPLARLSDLATLRLPGQFARIWARDAEHGVPYLNATDLLSLFALGTPAAAPRFLSRESETDIESLVIRRGWILMTCSGTIGRVFAVPKRLDGWAATHDLVRIIPPPGMAGYLYAWCSTPAARTQILSHTHGGQIDHVTEDQVARLLVPRLPADRTLEIDRAVVEALEARELALERLVEAWSGLSSVTDDA